MRLGTTGVDRIIRRRNRLLAAAAERRRLVRHLAIATAASLILKWLGFPSGLGSLSEAPLWLLLGQLIFEQQT